MISIYSMCIMKYKDNAFTKELKYSYQNAVEFSIENFERYMEESEEESYWMGVSYINTLCYLAEMMSSQEMIHNELDEIELLNGLLNSEKVKGNKECINKVIELLKKINDNLEDPRPYKAM